MHQGLGPSARRFPSQQTPSRRLRDGQNCSRQATGDDLFQPRCLRERGYGLTIFWSRVAAMAKNGPRLAQCFGWEYRAVGGPSFVFPLTFPVIYLGRVSALAEFQV